MDFLHEKEKNELFVDLMMKGNNQIIEKESFTW